MSLIRGVLLAGKFRTQHELNRMSNDDQRNTLIVELTNRSNQSNYQSFDDVTLAGMGAVLVFLRETGIRDDEGLRLMTADDQRNTLIVEIGIQNPYMAISELQEFSNMDLVLQGLGNERPGALRQPAFIRGVLLAGKYRTQYELNQMSSEDQRNTLIVELTKNSSQSNYQSFDDYTLAGMGAVLVFLRETGIRDDSALKTMSADDQRNTLIVEIDAQTRLGSRLQGLSNMDLVRLGLGMDPAAFFKVLPAPLRPLPRLRLQFRLRGFTQFQSTDDALQGARDEVYISAIGMDSSTFDPVSMAVDQIEAPIIGDVSDDRVRGPWSENPHVLFEFDLDRVSLLPFPRTYKVVLLVVEHDNEDLAGTFSDLKDAVRKAAQDAIRAVATSAVAGATGGAAAAAGGAAVAATGAVAAAVFLAGLALDELFSAISEGLANEVFTPKSLHLTILKPVSNLIPEEIDRPDWIEIREQGAVYYIHYDWHIQHG